MAKYSSYKDSGIYFLPELPDSWKIRKAKYLFNEEKRPVRPEDEIVTCFRDGQVTLRKNRRLDGFTNSMKEIGYQGVRKGDLVIHNMDAFAGAIGISDSDGKATPVYSCCTPKSSEVNQYYYCYLLRFLAHNGFILSLAKGIRERSTDFRFNDFKELYLPLPSRDEQNAIVAYLDSVTAKIDEAIFQQQRIIDLLNERKQILIDRAVSRGVPSVNYEPKLKESGYDWLGQIPAHWDINKLKYLCKMFGRIGFRGYSAEDLVEEGEGAVTLSPTNIIEGKLDFTECSYLSWQKYYESPEIMVFPGDVIFVKTASIGKTAYVESIPIETTVNPQILVLKDIIPNSEYLTFYLQSSFMQGWVKATANGSTILTIPQTTIGNYPIALPSPDEQVAIVDYLKVEIGKIERAKTSVKNTINLLQERKQIIINDIVIGKVKVV